MEKETVLILDASVAVKWFTMEPLRDKEVVMKVSSENVKHLSEVKA